MPTLKPYEAGVQGLRPSETGIEATAAAARRLSGIVSEIAEAKEKTGRIFSSTISDIGTLAHDHMAAIEVNRGAPAWAAKQLSLEQQWDATHKASPDNPANVPKFLNETLEPQLQQFRNSFFTDLQLDTISAKRFTCAMSVSISLSRSNGSRRHRAGKSRHSTK